MSYDQIMDWQKSENSYMITAFIDIALHYPEALFNIFTKEDGNDDEMTVSLQLDGQERTFKIDTYLPVRPGIDNYNFDLLWLQYLEKAFAKVYGAWSTLGDIGCAGEIHPMILRAPSVQYYHS